MKTPVSIDIKMLAPCGIDCTVCYRHVGKKPCSGCRSDNGSKTGYCARCQISLCAVERNVVHCFDCALFPCKLVKNIDKRYRTGYGVSLIENGLNASQNGVEHFLMENLQRYACSECGGVINMHDGKCSECGKPHMLGRRYVKENEPSR